MRFIGICAAVGGCLFFFILLGVRHYDWNVSALLHMDTRFGRDYQVPPGLVLYEDGGYDGMLYYQVARDIPLLIAGGTPTLDSPYRFQRIVLPLLGYLFSAGRPEALPMAFLLLNVAAILGSLALMLTLSKGREMHALAAVLTPAMLVGMLYSLTEPISTFFITVFLVSWMRQAKRITLLSLVPLTLSLFARETTVFLMGLLFVSALWKRQWKDAVLVLLPLVPFICWQWWLGMRFGSVGFQANSNIITLPLLGPIMMIQWLVTETGMRQIYRLSAFALLLFVAPLTVRLLRQVWQQKTQVSELTFLLLGLCSIMLSMHPHMWGVMTSIGRVVTPLYPIYALYAVEHDSRTMRRFSLYLILISVLGAAGVASVAHPYVLS